MGPLILHSVVYIQNAVWNDYFIKCSMISSLFRIGFWIIFIHIHMMRKRNLNLIFKNLFLYHITLCIFFLPIEMSNWWYNNTNVYLPAIWKCCIPFTFCTKIWNVLFLVACLISLSFLKSHSMEFFGVFFSLFVWLSYILIFYIQI